MGMVPKNRTFGDCWSRVFLQVNFSSCWPANGAIDSVTRRWHKLL